MLPRECSNDGFWLSADVQAMPSQRRFCLHVSPVSPQEGLNMERRLAAIIAADVVRFSSLIGENKAGTHERLRASKVSSQSVY